MQESPPFVEVQPEDNPPETIEQHVAAFEAEVFRTILTGQQYPAMPPLDS